MRKTLFLSEYKKTENNKYFKYQVQYIFFDNKWREDVWYFNSLEEAREQAKEQGFLIK